MTALAAERVGVVLDKARVVDSLGFSLEEGGWLRADRPERRREDDVPAGGRRARALQGFDLAGQ